MGTKCTIIPKNVSAIVANAVACSQNSPRRRIAVNRAFVTRAGAFDPCSSRLLSSHSVTGMLSAEIAASSRKPLCQPHVSITAAVMRGTLTLETPMPVMISASASPRASSNQVVTARVKLTGVVADPSTPSKATSARKTGTECIIVPIATNVSDSKTALPAAAVRPLSRSTSQPTIGIIIAMPNVANSTDVPKWVRLRPIAPVKSLTNNPRLYARSPLMPTADPNIAANSVGQPRENSSHFVMPQRSARRQRRRLRDNQLPAVREAHPGRYYPVDECFALAIELAFDPHLAGDQGGRALEYLDLDLRSVERDVAHKGALQGIDIPRLSST